MTTHDFNHQIVSAVAAEFGDQAEATDLVGLGFATSVPDVAAFGDFSNNVALVAARVLGLPPREIAQRLVERIQATVPEVERVEVAGPGFLNIWMTAQYWQRELASVSPRYASSHQGAGKKVQVEFISANPTGPTTIGNARGGFIGDVLSRVLEHAGYQVTREYYFNNAGTQMSKLLESVRMEAGLIPETEERQYRGDYIKALATEFAAELTSADDDRLKELIATSILKRYIEPAVAAMGIEFDVWFNEKDLLKDGRFEHTIKLLDERGLVFKRDGAVWLNTGDIGDERSERVIFKSNGDPTYMAPDIAYHADLFGRRSFDYAIKVLGPDHVAQFPSVYAAVHALYPDKRFTMAGYQWLRVMRDGREVKVSKRLGQFITVVDLVKEVGLPVARFLILMRSAEAAIDFDLDLAREQSAKNPYYYVMYAYARAHSVLAKAKERGLEPAGQPGPLTPPERDLVRAMSQLPEMVTEMAADYGVHRLTFYGLELAKVFTTFYEAERIIDLPPAEAATRLYTISQFVVFMDVYWHLLGIEPKAHMLPSDSEATA